MEYQHILIKKKYNDVVKARCKELKGIKKTAYIETLLLKDKGFVRLLDKMEKV